MFLNLYDICPKNNTIKVVMNKDLSEILNKSIKDLKIKKKDLAKNVNITYSTLWKWLNRKQSIPLKLFKNLKDNYNINLSKNI